MNVDEMKAQLIEKLGREVAEETFKLFEALGELAGVVVEEAGRAAIQWPPFNSAHEGYAVLLEEVRELEAHVFTKQSKRDLGAMRKEAIQVAAMALRFVHDVVDGDRGRK